MKKVIHFFAFLIIMQLSSLPFLYAQISEGGIPPSFAYTNIRKQIKEPVLVYLNDNIEKLKVEDSENGKNGNPLRVAKIIDVNLTTENSGEWITLPNGQLIWQLSVKTPDALATLLYYDEFYIPEGSRLFIYNNDKTHVLGAYTKQTNPKAKEFATEFVAGDSFTLEYVAGDNQSTDKPRIVIKGIAYAYNNAIIRINGKKAFGDAASCMVNINCAEGNDWQKQKRGVARTITPIGSSSYYCSGTIINNTANDLTPYYLTAHHCFYAEYTNIYAGEQGLNQMVFYFNYEHPDCDNLNTQPLLKTMVGAQMLVDNDIQGSSDGALLILNQDIPEDYNVYYNGWDRTNTAATSGVNIHHPRGDVKKISTYTASLKTATWYSDSETGAQNAHWEVRFSSTQNGHGVTEGGSSGSPLFNQNGLVVGTLTGGSTYCTLPNNADYFGKLWYHWDQDKDAGKHMKTYLDPLNKGNTILNGIYAKELVPSPRNLTAELTGVNNIKVELKWEAPDLTAEDHEDLVIDKYLIYRNSTKIDEVTTLFYMDNEAESIGNDLCYKVKALYTTTEESDFSNSACMHIYIPVKSIQLSPATLSLNLNTSSSLTATIIPENATNKIIKSWESDNSIIASVNESGVVRALNYGNATITAITEDGNFSASSVVNVYTIPEGSIKASDAFTPNGDGLNDYFIIERIEEFPNNQLTVFDRSGALHYTINGYSNNWDGIANTGPYKGQKVPVGTYYYQLTVDGKIALKSFMVIRY